MFFSLNIRNNVIFDVTRILKLLLIFLEIIENYIFIVEQHIVSQKHKIIQLSKNQSGAVETWWAHNPQVPGLKLGSDKIVKVSKIYFELI